MCLPNILFPVFMFALIFHCAHFFPLHWYARGADLRSLAR